MSRLASLFSMGCRWGEVHRLGFIAYLAAAVEFFREGQSSAALIAIALLGWGLAVELLADRTTWQGPAIDESGYGTGIPQRSADYLAKLDQFAFLARFLSIALGVFGPLLLCWSLLL